MATATAKASAKAAPAIEPMVLTFQFERATKNTLRYQEVSERERPAVGTLYITKAAMVDAHIGNAQTLTVTIEGSDE